MDEIETIPTRLKNFAVRYRGSIAVVATAITCLAINRYALKQHDEFLKEKGLFDEYYTPVE